VLSMSKQEFSRLDVLLLRVPSGTRSGGLFAPAPMEFAR
jgi:hypothetical protein